MLPLVTSGTRAVAAARIALQRRAQGVDALIAAVPYVALQFKAVAMSVEVLAPGSDDALFADPALYVALLLAAFAILFGTRQIDATAINAPPNKAKTNSRSERYV